MNDGINKNLSRKQAIVIISIALFLCVIAAVTYAFINNKFYLTNNQTVNVNLAERPSIIAYASKSISMNIELPAYVDTLTEIENDVVGLNVIMNPNYGDGKGSECSYDIVFEWDESSDSYFKTPGMEKEYTFSLKLGDNVVGTEANLFGYDGSISRQVLYSGTISNKGIGYTTRHFEATFRFYRGLQDQSYHLGKKYLGRLKVDNIVCKPSESSEGEDKLWLADYLIDKAVPGSVTEEVSTIATGATNVLADLGEYGVRYLGSSPNNWILFNCNDVNNPTTSTCERWRIIGVMDSDIHGVPGKSLVKIVNSRLESGYSFDKKYKLGSATDSGSTTPISEWYDSQMMMMLNPPEFLPSGYSVENSNNIITGYVYDQNGEVIFRNMGSYYYGLEDGYDPETVRVGNYTTYQDLPYVDFTSDGIRNDDVRDMIETVTIKTSNTYYSAASNFTGLAPIEYFNNESRMFNNDLNDWTGKIMLPTMSDYFLSTTGTTGDDGKLRTYCYQNSTATSGVWTKASNGCSNSTWITRRSSTATAGTISNFRTMTRGIKTTTVGVSTTGIAASHSITTSTYYTTPALFLAPNIRIVSGSGTYSSPFVIEQVK